MRLFLTTRSERLAIALLTSLFAAATGALWVWRSL